MLTAPRPDRPAFSISGAAIRTNDRIGHEFGTGGSPVVPVVRVSRGDLRQPGLSRQVSAAFARVAAAEPGSRVASYATTGATAFLSPDHRTEYALIFTAAGTAGQLSGGVIDAARRAARTVTVGGARVDVTGLDALRSGGHRAKATA